MTMDFDALKKGKFTFKEDGKDTVTFEANGDGQNGSMQVKSGNESMSFGANQAKMPSWIPSYPGSTPKGNFSMNGKDGTAASFTFETKDTPKDVVGFYENKLKDGGFHVTNTTTSENGANSGGLVTAEDEANKRNVIVTVGTSSGATTVNVAYQQK
jgi:hypothetical protein